MENKTNYYFVSINFDLNNLKYAIQINFHLQNLIDYNMFYDG